MTITWKSGQGFVDGKLVFAYSQVPGHKDNPVRVQTTLKGVTPFYADDAEQAQTRAEELLKNFVSKISG